MAKEVSKRDEKIIPKAVRIVEFTEEDRRENPTVVHLSEIMITKEMWEKFAEEALVFIDGWDILQYAEEFPIVMYQCDEVACYGMQPDYRLNSFIKSITVSTAMHGKRFSVGSGKMESEITDSDVVVYYEDNFVICHAVIQHDIFHLLIKKPELVISPEGVLIFYTDNEILATVDCQHYYWINSHVIDVDDKTIVDIEVYDDYCKVILAKDGVDQEFKLKFNFDMTAHIMIQPEVSEM